MIDWHRLFGITLTDFFTDTHYRVELEKDLSLKQQFLDVVIIEQSGLEVSGMELPEGLEALSEYNLLTYKSLREPLDAWALDELIGHYVNYRKQISPEGKLLPEHSFGLYAVSTRHPQGLKQKMTPTRWCGVYEINWGSRLIRVIVLNQIESLPKNAPWELFSAQADKFRHGNQHYHWHPNTIGQIFNPLYQFYTLENIVMPYTMEEFLQESTQQILQRLSLEERLKGLSPEERLKGLPAEDRLKGLPLEERLKGASIEEIKAWLKKRGEAE